VGSYSRKNPSASDGRIGGDVVAEMNESEGGNEGIAAIAARLGRGGGEPRDTGIRARRRDRGGATEE
jgi:hypothetical protein